MFGLTLAVRGAFHPFQNLQTGQTRQFQIQEREIKFSLLNQAQCVLAVVGCDRLVPHPGDTILESEKNIAVVVDDEDFCAHGVCSGAQVFRLKAEGC